MASDQHSDEPTIGILLTNLGTPDAPTPEALRKYLAEFLSDPKVIKAPKLVWWPILHGIILNTRPKKSAEAYAKIWTDEGSPLLAISRRQAAAITERLSRQLPGRFVVELAMRYGDPSIAAALERLRAANVQKLLVLPLYPQYSSTTTESTFDAITNVLKRRRWNPELKTIPDYHDHPAYTAMLADSVRRYQTEHGKPDRLLFSFHGLPKKYSDAGDPYFNQCLITAKLVAEQLQLEPDAWTTSFQSRFGPTEWLKPYTVDVLQRWAQEGRASVQVLCPGFPADCLETLEEINIQYRHRFLEAGGKQFVYIPALNDSPAHIGMLTDLLRTHL